MLAYKRKILAYFNLYPYIFGLFELKEEGRTKIVTKILKEISKNGLFEEFFALTPTEEVQTFNKNITSVISNYFILNLVKKRL
jgi:hypothetical protein